MKVRPYQLQSLYVVVMTLVISTTALSQREASSGQQPNPSTVHFTENRGQIVNTLGDLRPDILFTASASSVKLFFRPSGLSYVFFRINTPPRQPDAPDKLAASYTDNATTITSYRMDMDLVGANPRPVVAPDEQSGELINYYTRRFPQGINGIRSFGRLVYRDIYPNIDLVFYGSGGGLKYDFMVRPGGRVSDIRIRYTGAENIRAGSDGNVVASNPMGQVEEGKIFTYQQGTGSSTQPGSIGSPVRSSYTLSNGIISFNIASYDSTQPLVIDPPVMWSTYCGGSSSDLNASWNQGSTVIDRERNVLITGSAASVDFPVSLGAFQTYRMGPSFNYDAYVAKFSATGERRWATYFGGTSSDNSYGITADRGKNVIFAGTTSSYDFPTTAGAYRSVRMSTNNGFIVKLDSNGRRVWATYYPNGNCLAVGTDQYENIVVGGVAWADMPTTPNAFQPNVRAGGNDGFVAKFTSSGQLAWSTYYGGSSANESIGSIATDDEANVLVSGYTMSPDFPVSEGAFQPNLSSASNPDAFLIKFDSMGHRAWATYFGGTRQDYGYGIAADPDNSIVMTGYTLSSDLPVTRETFQPRYGGSTDGFVARFNPKGDRLWASYFGGSGSDLAYNVSIDGRGNAWIAGYTYSTDLPVSADAYQARAAGNLSADAMVAEFDRYGNRIWATYLGGSNHDYATGIATSPIGVVVTGNTLSVDMPTTDGAFQASNAGSYDAFITQFCNVAVSSISVVGSRFLCQGDSTILSAPAGFHSYMWSNGETTREIVVKQSGRYRVTLGIGGCDGSTDAVDITVYPTPRRVIGVIGSSRLCDNDGRVVLTLGGGLRSYHWSTGETTPVIVVREPGEYMVAFTDSNGCHGRSDTFVVARYQRPMPVIAVQGALDFCEGGIVELDAGEGYSSYLWSNGETGQRIVTARSGVYSVRVANSAGCSAESAPVTVAVRPRPNFKIAALLPTAFCQGDSTILTASEAYPSYKWSTGETTRTITVRKGGQYTLTAFNANGCETTAAITVQTAPDPNPSISMNRPPRICAGESIVLDAGDGYTEYRWNTGQVTQRIVVSEPGLYSVKVTTILGCTGTSSMVNVEVVEKPVAAFGGARMVCTNATVSYTASVVSGMSYSWDVSGAGGRIIEGYGTHRIRVQWKDHGIGAVHLSSGIGGSDCIADSTLKVEVGSAMMPVITAAGPTALCPGGSVLLDAGEGYSSYYWSTGARTQTLLVADPGSYDVTVTTEDACAGSSEPVAITLANPPAPAIMALGSTTFCTGDSVVLDAGEGYSRYEWSTGDKTRFLTARDAASYFVVVTSSSGCSAVSPMVQTAFSPAPSPRISGENSFCKGAQIAYSAPQVDGHRYNWQPDGGVIVSGQGTSRVVVEWSGDAGWDGIGKLDLTQESASGACIGVAPTMTVQAINTLEPVIRAMSSTTICTGDSVVLDAGPGFQEYLWSNGATTQTITVRDMGEYSVLVTGVGCPGRSQPVKVTTRELPPPAIAPLGPTEFCEGENVTLRASEGYASYHWSTGATTREITVDRSGIYTVTVGDAGGCSAASMDLNVIVHARPARPVIAERGPMLAAPDAAGYIWWHDGKVIAGESGQEILANQEGDYTVTIRNAAGCEAISEPFHRTISTVVPNAVRLDTISEHVGNKFQLTMYVARPLSPSDGLTGYKAWVRIPTRSFFVHRVVSPDASVTGEYANVTFIGGDTYIVERPAMSPVLSGDWLFRIELEGLSTGVPVNDIVIDSVLFIGAQRPIVIGNGMVVLTGCDISRGFDFSKRARLQAIRPNPVSRETAILYRAPVGAVATIRLISTVGKEVLSMPLAAGTGEDQEFHVDLGAVASGVYTLELRDGNELSTMPLVIRK